jgi:hypothetical protein
MPLVDNRARFRPAPYPDAEQARRILMDPSDIPSGARVLKIVTEDDYNVKVTPVEPEVLVSGNITPTHLLETEEKQD